MDEVDKILTDLLHKTLREWPDIVEVKILEPIPTGPVKLAVVPFCDRSRPPFLFCIYDDNGEVVIDDC